MSLTSNLYTNGFYHENESHEIFFPVFIDFKVSHALLHRCAHATYTLHVKIERNQKNNKKKSEEEKTRESNIIYINENRVWLEVSYVFEYTRTWEFSHDFPFTSDCDTRNRLQSFYTTY